MAPGMRTRGLSLPALVQDAVLSGIPLVLGLPGKSLHFPSLFSSYSLKTLLDILY